MKTGLVAFALATLAFTGLALAEKPEVKPYAAGGALRWNSALESRREVHRRVGRYVQRHLPRL